MNLFTSNQDKEQEENYNEEIILTLPDSDIIYYPNFYSIEEASALFENLKSNTSWQQDDITVYGKTYPQPRLTALYSLETMIYSYSGISMNTMPFTPTLIQIKNKIEENSKEKFNAVLLNLYRDGNDSVGWHSDDEKELGKNPIIASLTLGEERMFHLRHKNNKLLKSKFLLQHGSLLLMKGKTQHFWQHQIPKSKKINKSRINLTFRIIKKLPENIVE